MKKLIIPLTLLFITACTQLPNPEVTKEIPATKIANWNLQIFGETKANNTDLMNRYKDIIKNYDIIFIQEIRNEDQTAFPKLCNLLKNYNCEISSRAGRSSSKEQYGIIYKKGIKLNLKDYNPDKEDRWERPPIEAVFTINNYNITIYNIHTKPENVKEELSNLENIVKDEGNAMIIGDLNADCSYYKNENTIFKNWNWIIKDKEDTTVSSTDCAYDRIILNKDASDEFVNYGIFKNVNKSMSDHYLVWIGINTD